MLFLPAILLAALGGRGPSLAAAALSVAAFDFFFVPPRFTFAVSDVRSLITFAVMFVVGTAIGTLVARLRAAEAASRERERRTAALLAFTRDAAAATDVAGVDDRGRQPRARRAQRRSRASSSRQFRCTVRSRSGSKASPR